MSLSLAKCIFDLLVPRECPACGIGHELAGNFCGDCEQDIKTLIDAPRCARCAMPSAKAKAPCAYCAGHGLSAFAKIICLGVLKNPVRLLIHRAKYERRWPLAEMLADRLAQQMDLRNLLSETDLIVPVPLHPKRHRQRGYNQAEVIARRICSNSQYQIHSREDAFDRSAKEAQLPFDPQPSWRAFPKLLGRSGLSVGHPAVRIKNTSTQSLLKSRAQRLANLRDAFVLTDPNQVTGKNVVLLDDVLTSGATLIALARTLQPAKPASLSAIVLAVADPKGRSFEVI